MVERFSTSDLIAEAAALDAGFTPRLLADQLSALDRYRDQDLPIHAADVVRLRTFFAEWRNELMS